MNKTTAMLALVLLLIPGLALAQLRDSGTVVKVAPAKAAVSAETGQRFQFTLDLDIDPTWHVYAHEDTTFIGVDLVAAEDFPVEDLQIKYPAGHEGEFFGEKVVMIKGKQAIHGSALVPEDLAKGEHKLEMAVTVQACDDKTCLAPADLPVTLVLTVE